MRIKPCGAGPLHILQALHTIMFHEHEGAEQNAWRVAAIAARSGHETIHPFIQSQAFD